MGPAGDEPFGLQGVEQAGHRGSGHEQAVSQLARLEHAPLGVVQRHEDVAGAGGQPQRPQLLRLGVHRGVVGAEQPDQRLDRQRVAVG